MSDETLLRLVRHNTWANLDHRAHVGTILGAHGVETQPLDVWAYGRSVGEVIPPP